MADYLGKHFVAAYQQVGDFEVVKVNGRLKKNGGNVVSYFCTPAGRVIHAVVGPVSPHRLLEEAQWAVQTFRDVRQNGEATLRQRRFAMEVAHLQALGRDPRRYRELVRHELPGAVSQYRDRVASLRKDPKLVAKYKRSGQVLHSPLTVARRRAARRLGGDRVHQILAAQPLALLGRVYHEFFENLANERVNIARGRIRHAAQRLKEARKRHRPVVLILYRGKGEMEEYDASTKELLAGILHYGSRDPGIRAVTKVAVPLDELSALSNLADIPLYEIPRKTSPIAVLAHSDGRPFEVIAGITDARVLMIRIRRLLVVHRLRQIKSLLASGKLQSAERMVRGAVRLTQDRTLRRRLRNRLAEIHLARADAFLDEGKRQSAKRRLKIVQAMDVDDRFHRRAEQRLSDLSAATTVSASATE